MKTILLIMLLVLVACQKPDVQVPSTQNNIKEWKSPSPYWSMSFLNMTYDGSEFKMIWALAYNQVCESTAVTLLGDQSSGHINIIQTDTIVSNPNGPPCSMFDGEWSYAFTVTNKVILCQESPQPSPCVTFQ